MISVTIKSCIKLETEFTDVAAGVWLILTRVKEDFYKSHVRI